MFNSAWRYEFNCQERIIYCKMNGIKFENEEHERLIISGQNFPI